MSTIDDTPPRGGAKWDLVTVGETAQRSVNIGLENAAELRAMRVELQTEDHPVDTVATDRPNRAVGVAALVLLATASFISTTARASSPPQPTKGSAP